MRRGSASSGASRITSRVRSRPASASVSCVPIDTIWNIGATRNPSSSVYVKKPPSVSDPARICRAPTYITAAPTTPIRTVDASPITEVAVSVFMTFASSRATPPAKTSASRDSAW